MSQVLHILVVEDNPADADLIGELLPKSGSMTFQIEWVARAAHARLRLEGEGFDLVLLDLGLPDSQGLQTLRELHQAAPDVPVIVLTGTDDQELGAAAVRDGAQDYLVKGQVNENLLVRSIKYALERHNAAMALHESERHFSQMFHSSPVAMSLSTLKEGRYLDVNAEFLKMSGGSREEMVGHTVFELGLWVNPERRGAIMAQVEEHGMVRNIEFDLRNKSGQIRQVLWSVQKMVIGGASCVLGSALDITERKRVEEALRFSEERLRLVTENARVGLVVVNHERRYAFANAAYAEILELPSANITGLRVADVLGSIYEAQIRPRLDHAFAGERVTYELVKPVGGVEHIYAVTHEPINQEGLAAQVVVVITDITPRKQTERLLEFVAQEGWRGQEDFLARLVQFIGRTLAVDYVFVGRCEGGQAVHTIGAYAKGRIVPDFEYPTRGAPCGQVIGKTLCHYGNQLQELFPDDTLLAEMGAQSYLGIPLTDSSGQPLGLMAILDTKPMPDSHPGAALLRIASVRVAGEIERRARVEELRWQAAQLEAQLEAAPDGILVVNREGRKVLQNHQLLKMFEVPEEIANHHDDSKLFQHVVAQTKNPAQFIERIHLLHAHPTEVTRDEIELADGRIVDRYSAPVGDQAGANLGRIWTFRDITKARQLEAQYRQAQKMEAIGTLAGGIAHDFNNILGAMLGYSYLLQLDTEGNPSARENVDQILVAANRAKDLVQQILTFSRQGEQKRKFIHLDPVVKEAMKFLRASLPAQIRIELDIASDVPAVLADATQIYQVTMNLATNALHAMEGHPGQLTIKLNSFVPDENFIQAHSEFRAMPYARLTVADTGHGMDVNTMERIFEPFFTTKPVGKGTGLGLSVVHGIVHGHEGLITVESEIGRGTTFSLYFPPQTQVEIQADDSAERISPGRGENVLVLDDEPTLTAVFQKILRRLNYQTTITNSALEAIQLVRQNPAHFDLLITDMTMPELNGLEVARQIRSLRPDLPVILASGYTSLLNSVTLREVGICELIEKPVSLRVLAGVVQRALIKA